MSNIQLKLSKLASPSYDATKFLHHKLGTTVYPKSDEIQGIGGFGGDGEGVFLTLDFHLSSKFSFL